MPALPVAISAFTLLGAAAGAAAQCSPEEIAWTDEFATDGLNDAVYAAVAWDPDGAGPEPERLVVGGAFTAAGETALPHVAMVVDGELRPLDPGSFGGEGYVTAMTVADLDGDPATPPSLFAVGSQGGMWENRGEGWIEHPAPLWIEALTAYDADGPGGAPPVLAAAVRDTLAMVYDGSSWRTLGPTGIEVRAESITTFEVGGERLLVVGGEFEVDLGGETARHIAAWDGSAWRALPGGPDDGDVAALTVHDADGEGPEPPALYATGRFTTIGGGPGRTTLAKWDGDAWSSVSADVGTTGAMLSVDFDGAGPQTPALVVAGTSVEWLQDGVWRESGRLNSNVWAAAAVNPDGSGALWVGLGGRFGSIGDAGTVASAPHLAAWDPAGGLRPVGAPENGGLDHEVTEMAIWRPGGGPAVLAAVGRFRSGGGAAADALAIWNGDAWSAVPEISPILPEALATGSLTGDPADEALFVGDDHGRIWSFDGETVEQIRVGTSLRRERIFALAVLDVDGAGPAPGELYMAVEEWEPQVYRYDSLAGWVSLGVNADDLTDLAVHDPDGAGPQSAMLLAAGTFDDSHVQQWDGGSWSALGDRDVEIKTLLVVEDAGAAPSLFGAGRDGVHRWDGAAWMRLGPAFGDGALDDDVYALAAAADGAGGIALFAGGQNLDVGSDDTSIARFDGSRWWPITPDRRAPGGTMSANTLLAVPCGSDFPQGLYAGGDFKRFGDQSAMHIARGVFADACYADCDGDGELTFFDFLCFQNLFAAGDPQADCDGDGELTFFDFLCSQNAFATGCP